MLAQYKKIKGTGREQCWQLVAVQASILFVRHKSSTKCIVAYEAEQPASIRRVVFVICFSNRLGQKLECNLTLLLCKNCDCLSLLATRMLHKIACVRKCRNAKWERIL